MANRKIKARRTWIYGTGSKIADKYEYYINARKHNIHSMTKIYILPLQSIPHRHNIEVSVDRFFTSADDKLLLEN